VRILLVCWGVWRYQTGTYIGTGTGRMGGIYVKLHQLISGKWCPLGASRSKHFGDDNRANLEMEMVRQAHNANGGNGLIIFNSNRKLADLQN